MTAPFDASSSAAQDNAPDGWNWSHTVDATANILFIGVVHHFDGQDVSGITYGGESMTQVEYEYNSGFGVVLFKLLKPPTGANNVVVSVGGDGNLQHAAGVGASYILAGGTRTAQKDYAAAGAVSVNLSDGVAGDLGVAVGGVYDNGGLDYPSWANGETVRVQDRTGTNGDVGAAIADLDLSGGTTMGLDATEDKEGIVAVPVHGTGGNRSFIIM